MYTSLFTAPLFYSLTQSLHTTPHCVGLSREGGSRAALLGFPWRVRVGFRFGSRFGYNSLYAALSCYIL